MMKHSKLVLALGASLALGLAACGDDDDDTPSKVECTSSAECAANTDGRTQCDLSTNTCVKPECNISADCANNVDGKTDCNPTTHQCVLPAKDCTKDEECDSQLCGADSKCATTKSVDCKDAPPAHAESASTDVKVTVNFVEGAWEEAAACPWYCVSGYQKDEAKTGCEELPACTVETQETACRSKICGTDGKCATTKQDKCNAYTADEMTARHAATQDSEALVEHKFVENPDGSSGWVAEGHCAITGCVDDYELNEAKDACILAGEVESCSKDDDCKNNAEKIKCDTWSDTSASKGVCFKPQCTKRSDCGANEYCNENHWTCDSGCLYNSDCEGRTDGKSICSSMIPGYDGEWECIAPQCTAEDPCSEDLNSYCVDGLLTACPANQKCVPDEGQNKGKCMVPSVDVNMCNPVCDESTQFCRDNGESITDPTERYTCEYNGSQKGDKGIVISQVYFGGYNSDANALYKNGFYELYNTTDSAISLKSYKLYKGTRAGDFTEVKADFATGCNGGECVIPAKGYFTILDSGANNSAGKANVDSDIKLNIKVSVDGSLAITTGTVTDTTCNGVKKLAIDLIGMDKAYCSEGNNPAKGIARGTYPDSGNAGTHSYMRATNGDTDVNFDDFTTEMAVVH